MRRWGGDGSRRGFALGRMWVYPRRRGDGRCRASCRCAGRKHVAKDFSRLKSGVGAARRWDAIRPRGYGGRWISSRLRHFGNESSGLRETVHATPGALVHPALLSSYLDATTYWPQDVWVSERGLVRQADAGVGSCPTGSGTAARLGGCLPLIQRRWSVSGRPRTRAATRRILVP